jgi:septum formation protein
VIVLASASPRRRELLREAGLSFEVAPAGVEETFLPDRSPQENARALACEKARQVAGRRPGAWVVGADTVVAVPAGGGWDLLGKPGGEDEARAMLARLSGTRHQVVTGVCVVAPGGASERADCETTWVRVREITAAEREAYVASGEWRDKAGGYAIQETADRFVTGLEGGGFDNVVGLPVGLTLRLLADLGCPGLPPPLARPAGPG